MNCPFKLTDGGAIPPQCVVAWFCADIDKQHVRELFGEDSCLPKDCPISGEPLAFYLRGPLLLRSIAPDSPELNFVQLLLYCPEHTEVTFDNACTFWRIGGVSAVK